MKTLLLALLIMSPVFTQVAEAQVSRPRSAQWTSARAGIYCTEERFASYVLLASSMRDYVTPLEYSRLYIPLKIRASKAQIALRNYGPLSATTHAALYDIVKFVRTNQESFDALREIEAFFQVAVDLFDMTESLARDLK